MYGCLAKDPYFHWNIGYSLTNQDSLAYKMLGEVT